jgi:rhamnulokinase
MAAAEAKFLAFDLGAESGRAVTGFFDGAKLRLEDVHRFPTGGTRIVNTLHWDALRLYAEIVRGLGMAVEAHGADYAGLGIDTWAVDFGLLGKDDAMLGNPRHYRDHANDGMMEAAFTILPREQIYHRTGIQFLQFNTLYQLLSLQKAGSPLLENAQTLLMMPDLLHFWLTGVKATEWSNATSTQMVDPRTRRWDDELLSEFALPRHILTDIVPSGTPLGKLRPFIASEAGCGRLQVIAPGTHDTASAVVAVPSTTPDYAYISSGTWSLVGIETPAPLISPQTLQANFTNEGGACNTIRLLKNVMGLWLVQECRRSFERQGEEYSYATLTALAERADPFGPLIDPDFPAFLAPDDMAAEIRAFCVRTGQTPPDSVGAFIRCCLESLALKYRWVVERLEEVRGKSIDTIHVVGGGTQNRLLCQLTADATRRTVIAGPVEATAIGNILMQALGMGHIGSLEQARTVVRNSFALDTYTPATNAEPWNAAYQRLLALLQLES